MVRELWGRDSAEVVRRWYSDHKANKAIRVSSKETKVDGPDEVMST